MPLLSIAKNIGEPFVSELNQSYFKINSEIGDEEDIGVELLMDIKSIFESLRIDTIHSYQLISELIRMDGRPWSEWKRGKAMTANSLSRLLKPFKIKPKDIREGNVVRKGYSKKEFMDSFERYI